MEYFVLQARTKTKNGYFYHIPGLKNDMGGKMEQVPPTQASRTSGLLEWIVPNNKFNQNWVSMHYSHLKILHAGEEQEFKAANLMPNMPPPKEPSTLSKSTSVAPPQKTEGMDIGHQMAAQGGMDLNQPQANPELEAALAIVAKNKAEREAMGGPSAVSIPTVPNDTVEVTLPEATAKGPITPPVVNYSDEPILAPPGGLPGAEMPKVPDGPGSIDEGPAPTTKLSPTKINQLKVETSKKLTELGVEVPKNSSLPQLEALLNQKLATA
jgi:hypothetical protein